MDEGFQKFLEQHRAELAKQPHTSDIAVLDRLLSTWQRVTNDVVKRKNSEAAEERLDAKESAATA